jgi:hypothetical protein
MMTYDLTKFDLGDMLKCSLRLREAATGAPTLEASAQRACRFLYDELRDPGGQRACTLVRCYKTHPFGLLESHLQAFARDSLGAEPPRSTMKCLTLMATVGQSASWNSRFLSRDHRTIPLPSPEIVEKAPMIAQLIKELGFPLSSLLQTSPEVVQELGGKRHGIFHVEDAVDSPFIPAQREFVTRFGIRSVLGFGGMLPSAELFAIIMFTNVTVTANVAARFRALALDVKSAFVRYDETSVFNQMRPSTADTLRAQ